MKNRLFTILIISTLFLLTSCQKDLTGNPITIEASSNTLIDDFDLYTSCSPGPGGLPLDYPDSLHGDGNGNYSYQIDAGYSPSQCFTIGGTIPANTDSTGKTIVNIDIFYTEEGNVVGFQDIELQRPHDAYAINYEFRPDTYVE